MHFDIKSLLNTTPEAIEEVDCCCPDTDAYQEFGLVQLYSTYHKDCRATVFVYRRVGDASLNLDVLVRGLINVFQLMAAGTGQTVYRITGQHVASDELAFMIVSPPNRVIATAAQFEAIPSDGSEAFAQYCFDGIIPGKKE